MGRLQHLHQGTLHTLSAEHRVGRASGCTMRLDSDYASAHHALIAWSNQSWVISDLGSRNGTFLDGVRLAPGRRAALDLGAMLTFADRSEQWRVVDVAPPGASLAPLDGGQPLLLEQHAVALPSDDSPSAVLVPLGHRWLLEQGAEARVLDDGAVFHVGERAYRFHGGGGAVVAETVDRGERGTGGPNLRFVVSSDEEHVELCFERDGAWHSLGERTCYYLALTLARERVRQQRAGAKDPGWLEVDELLRMLPEYRTVEHLNVDVHRLRTTLQRAGVESPAKLIERRRGRLRLGVSNLEIGEARATP